MWSIKVKSPYGPVYHTGIYRTRKAARIHLFDRFMDFPKAFWSCIDDNSIVNHTGSGDAVYSIVKLQHTF